MADEFRYSASVELDITKFNNNLAEAEKRLTAMSKGSTVASDALQELLKRHKALENSATIFSRMGKDSGIAASQMKTLADASERLLRSTNKLSGAGSKTGTPLTTNQKDEAKSVQTLLTMVKQVQQATAKKAADADKAAAAAEREAKANERSERSMNKQHSQALRMNDRFDRDRAKSNQDAAFASYGPNLQATKNIESATRANEQYYEGLVNLRYAMYDVANTAGIMGAAFTGAAIGATALSVQFERAFADVERTSGLAGENLAQLQNQLIDLSTSMPTSFGDVTDIATLAGQLGIASDRIGDFTKVVSQFAATTDVTVDAAAEGLGRLAQLAKVPEDEYVNLGSAIYEVGVNSVATESAILGVAQQIAVSGNLAGFSADQVVALSGALASLGVAPESARGSIMRIFNNITKAVDGGGEALDAFASTAGVSAEEFTRVWRDDPQEAFLSLVHGFDRVADSGGNLVGRLQELGVWAVRDQRALQLLANNTEVYEQAITDSSAAYAEGTSLQEGYAIIAETTAAKLQVLLQTLQAIVAEGLAPLLTLLKPAIDLLQRIADGALAFAQTDIGGALLSGVTGLSAFIGLLGLAVAGYARATGAIAGFITATRESMSANLLAGGAQKNLIKEMSLAIGVWRAQSAAIHENTAARARNTGAALASIPAQLRSAGAAQVAATGFRAASTAAAGLARIAWPIAAIAAVGAAVSVLSEEFKSAGTRANEIFGSQNTALQTAIKEDTAALAEGGTAFREYTYQVDAAGSRLGDTAKNFTNLADAVQGSRGELPEWAQALEDSAGAQVTLGDETDATTGKIKAQTVALGDAAKTALATQLANNEDFQKFFQEYGSQLEEMGINIGDLIADSLASPNGGSQRVQEEIDKISKMLYELGEAPGFGGQFQRDPTNTRAENAELDRLQAQYDALLALQKQIEATDSTINGTLSGMELLNQIGGALGITFDEGEEGADGFNDALASLADGLFDVVAAQGAFTESLFGLHEALAENGNDFSSYTEGGVANMQALQSAVQAAADQAGQDVGQFGNNLATIFAQMEGAGYTAGSELDFLRTQLINTFNTQYGLDLDISNARGSIQQFIADAITALQVRANLERGVTRGINIPRRAGKERATRGIDLPDPTAEIDAQIRELQLLQGQLGRAGKAGKDVGKAIKDGMNEGAKGAKKAGDAAKKAADDAEKAVYTLLDYASDLQSIFDRAMDLRFGNLSAIDDTADILQNMRDAADESAKKLRDLRQELKELRADLGSLASDRRILQFQLGIAVEYGDELRASEIRAELAENSAEASDKQNDLKDTQEELRDEQDNATKSLEGNTKGARDNRETVENLLDSYKSQLVTMAQNGATADQLKRKNEELRREFVNQLTQMGYNRREVEQYARSFDDFAEIIRKVPRNITIKTSANTSPATQALNEWIAKNKNKSITVKTKTTTPKVGGTVSGGSWKPTSIAVGSGKITTRGIANGGTISGTKSISTPVMYATSKVQTPTLNATKAMAGGQRLAKGGEVASYHARGGVHGIHPGSPKGTDTSPAWLTPGEFVQQKRAVDYYGLPFMNALNNLKLPRYMSGGGPVVSTGTSSGGGGPQLVELLPSQVRAIINGLSVNIGIGANQVANATNGVNSRRSQRGSN